MSKKIVNTRNRQRIQAELMSFVDNGNGTAKIADVASNITEQGTRLDEVLLNGMQQGLVFTVDSNMTTKAGYDSYELGIDGMAGADNLNGFPMFSGFSLKFKAGATNTQGVVKVKISGTEYDLVKTFGTSVNAIASGEIKQGNIYDITFDGVRFSIFQNNINAYGLEAGTVLEGSRLAEALGVKKYGGLITQSGQKFADWAYYDPGMHEIFYCKANNTDVTAVADKFEPFSNAYLLKKILELTKFETYDVHAIYPLMFGTYSKLGRVVTITLDTGIVFSAKDYGYEVEVIPASLAHLRPTHGVYITVTEYSGIKGAALTLTPDGKMKFHGNTPFASAIYVNVTYIV